GHKDEILTVRFSADDRRLITGSADRTARVWDAQSGQQLVLLAGHQHFVWDAVFTAAGYATASQDKTVPTWAADGTPPRGLTGHGGTVSCLAVDESGRRLLAGGADGAVFLWDLAQSTGRRLAQYPSSVTALGWLSSGAIVGIGLSNGAAYLHDLE